MNTRTGLYTITVILWLAILFTLGRLLHGEFAVTSVDPSRDPITTSVAYTEDAIVKDEILMPMDKDAIRKRKLNKAYALLQPLFELEDEISKLPNSSLNSM
jgi:hypothetical protein